MNNRNKEHDILKILDYLLNTATTKEIDAIYGLIVYEDEITFFENWFSDEQKQNILSIDKKELK